MKPLLPAGGGVWGGGVAANDRLCETPYPPAAQFQVNDAPHRLGHAGGMTGLKLACGRGVAVFR